MAAKEPKKAMTVSDVIAALSELPPDAELNFYDNDPERGWWYTVTQLDLSVDEDGKNAYMKP